MKVYNLHSRTLPYPKEKIAELFDTLSSENDLVWPVGLWPRMKLDRGLSVGSKGGHGPIGYFIKEYEPANRILFEFTQPKGFHGYHEFELIEKDQQTTEIRHLIQMRTRGLASLTWAIFFRWLHDALVEDAFDKVESSFFQKKEKSRWNLWVKILRMPGKWYFSMKSNKKLNQTK